MKLITHLILLIALVAIPARADNANNQTANPPAQTAQPKTDYKDAFLKFVLDKADKYSGTVENAVGKAVDTITEETPKVAQEYLVWRAWYHGMCFLIPVFIFIASIASLYISNKTAEWSTGYDSGLPNNLSAVVFIISIVLGVVSFVITLMNLEHLLSFIQVIVAPRIYIIEQVIDVIKR